METTEEIKKQKLQEFKQKYPMVDSGDLQTFILGMNAMSNEESLKHQAKVIFKDNGYFLDNKNLPGFIKSYLFQDEYEASMVYGLWLQFSKGKTNNECNYGEFQFIITACFRIVNVKSNWK